jgi:hypothetical protein
MRAEKGTRMQKKCFTVVFFLFVFSSPALARNKVPDNKGTSDEAARVTIMIASRLAKDEDSRNYFTPGLPVVSTVGDADYVIRILPLIRVGEGVSNIIISAWIFDKSGQEIWAHDYSSTYYNSTSSIKNRGLINGLIIRDSAPDAVIDLVHSLKSAQINDEGKRAGFLGFKNR